ncbi:MAG TPA: glutamate-1-semialdehyde 2,1-aminomutase, partial [Thermoleophilia bacterium]|nr:glutamate-1-semialdehyde 2,1-aminomutase [Thermoleophilia bacterium]
YLYDVDGNRYVDYVLSWGPLVLGHAHPHVVEALERAVRRGTSYGAPTPLEVELAQLIINFVPSIELLRLVNSGTEATMSAIRLARAFTGRDKVVKFAGGYHGHADAFLVKAGSGVSTFGLPDSPGVTAAATSDTLTCAFNDLRALEDLFSSFPGQIAAVIAEPLMANMGFIMPRPGFLAGIQELCQKSGALFILDEVITGFRLGLEGAQGLWELEPDLTCLGKVIGGGLPLGAYGGKRAVMEMVAPAGPVYQAGTLSGNPLATTAGLATLKTLLEPGTFAAIETTAQKLAVGIGELAVDAGIPVQIGQLGTVFGFFFLGDPGAEIGDASSAKLYADTKRYATFFHLMLEQGVYFAPSQFEVAFASAAHGESEVEATLRAVEKAFRQLFAPLSPL